VVELNADGTDYLAHGDFAEDEFGPGWAALRGVLQHARDKLTREEIRRAWPEGEAVPSHATLWRWLERALAEGRGDGHGQKSQPYRFWLAEKEAEWAADPLRQFEREQAEAMRLLQEAGVDLGRLGVWPER
jgi:hypothetical protein